MPASVPLLRRQLPAGAILLGAAVVALVWANSPWPGGYEDLWGHEVLGHDLRHWVEVGPMTLFFLVVGVEVKREVVAGELRDPRAAALPVLAALGGMAVPALLYALVHGASDGPGAAGLGVPMATDIAFALGVVAVLGDRVPAGLRLFLLTLAVVDDVGAVVVIAVAYSGPVEVPALVVALALLAVAAVLLRRPVPWPLPVVAGVGVWLAVLDSGVHATIAGVALGLVVPARPGACGRPSTAERVERALQPWVTLVVLPLFALAAAGVRLADVYLDAPGAGAVAAGIVAGLVLGKPAGVLLASWLAVRTGVARLPPGVGWGQLAGVGAVAGIGFTVSLFVAGLAFDDDDPALLETARAAVLAASTLAAAVGLVGLRLARSRTG